MQSPEEKDFSSVIEQALSQSVRLELFPKGEQNE